VVESYRRIRNTLRFLLANTADFDPSQHAVPIAELFELDRFAIAQAQMMATAVEADYARYEFHVVVQRLQTYCSEELGGFYLDVLKDRLYTAGRDSRARRSAQTALALIRDALLKLMAPILSFTAEEAWRVLRPGEPTIFTHVWKDSLPLLADEPALFGEVGEDPGRARRGAEAARKRAPGRHHRSSLQAEAAISAPEPEYAALASLGDDLRFVTITSVATVVPGAELAINVTPSPHAKCERCWHWRADVGADRAHPTLCSRCVANLFGDGEPRRYA
jgi:isoleucyl-tRNA synthetase